MSDCNNGCVFTDEFILKMANQLDEPKAIFTVAIQLGLDFLAIKTLEEHFLHYDKIAILGFSVFVAYIDTRGKCSDESIWVEILEKLKDIDETEETSVKTLMRYCDHRKKDASGPAHEHKIRKSSFCEWELYEDRFQITNEMILHLGDVCEGNNLPPGDAAIFLGIEDYFYIINQKFPCHRADDDQTIVDKYESRKRFEVLFKGRENHDVDGQDFLKKLGTLFRLPSIEKMKTRKSEKYIRIHKINNNFKEISIWEKIVNS